MDCPTCKEPLIVLEYQSVEVDYCVGCEGVWLDAGELELLFGDVQTCADFLTIGGPADAGGEKVRKCPICNAKMTKEATESSPPVIYDHCPNGDGLWFDDGELQQVLSHAQALGGNEEVTGFLKGMFKE